MQQLRHLSRFSTNNLATFEIEGMVGRHKLYLDNASQGGLCFYALACMKKGTHVGVSFNGKNAKTRAEVTWSKYQGHCNCQLGLTFDEPIEQSALKRIVH